jgi:hypothetical protein
LFAPTFPKSEEYKIKNMLSFMISFPTHYHKYFTQRLEEFLKPKEKNEKEGDEYGEEE